MIELARLAVSSGLGSTVTDGLAKTASHIAEAGSDFTKVLSAGEAAAIGGVTGEVPIYQAIEKVLEAERAVQAAVTIRDKIVSAYLEISRMQI